MPITIDPSGATPFPFDPARTAIIQEYRETGMIADQVLPKTPPLGKTEFKYFAYDKESVFEVPDTELGRKSMAQEVEFGGKEVTDSTRHHGLRDTVPQDDVDNAAASVTSASDWVDPIDTASLFLTHLLHLAREKRVADAVFNAASYDAGYKVALANGNRFDDAATDVWGIMETALTTPLMRPNVVIFGQEVWSKFRQHPKVIKAVNRNDGDSGLAERMAVARHLEVDEVLVGRTRLANNKPGQALDLSRVWGKYVACIYRGAYAMNTMPSGKPGSEALDKPVMIGDRRRPTFGFTALYKDLSVYSQFKNELGVAGGTQILVRESCKEVISGKDGCGYLISTAVD